MSTDENGSEIEDGEPEPCPLDWASTPQLIEELASRCDAMACIMYTDIAGDTGRFRKIMNFHGNPYTLLGLLRSASVHLGKQVAAMEDDMDFEEGMYDDTPPPEPA